MILPSNGQDITPVTEDLIKLANAVLASMSNRDVPIDH